MSNPANALVGSGTALKVVNCKLLPLIAKLPVRPEARFE